ncbi:MAG: hypothetical protein AABX38_07885 [Candidatus Micrarchaeota archaeon]
MTRLVFVKEKIYTIYTPKEVAHSSTLTKSELPLLETLPGAVVRASELGIRTLLLGGLACRIYSDSEQKGRASTLIATDIDLVAHSIPDESRTALVRASLIDSIDTSFGTMSGTRTKITPSKYGLFRMTDVPNVDLFYQNVGPIIVDPSDFEHTLKIAIVTPTRGSVLIELADPALLLATIINPTVASDQRSSRANLVIFAFRNQIEATAQRFAQIISRTSEPFEKSFETVFTQMQRVALNEVKDSIRAFISEVRKHLETS